jgi:hypothetical protein
MRRCWPYGRQAPRRRAGAVLTEVLSTIVRAVEDSTLGVNRFTCGSTAVCHEKAQAVD